MGIYPQFLTPATDNRYVTVDFTWTCRIATLSLCNAWLHLKITVKLSYPI